jgi:hypothetical protein
MWSEIGATLRGAVPVVQAVAPTIASALGGPLAGLAVQALGNALLGKPAASAAEVNTALASATPDQLLALKREEDAFKQHMADLDVDLVRIAAADRDSARQRESRSGDSLTPRILAATITLGFFAVLGGVLTHGTPANGGDAVMIILGSLTSGWVAVVSYYFGSSAGSAAKTDHLAALASRPDGGA